MTLFHSLSCLDPDQGDCPLGSLSRFAVPLRSTGALGEFRLVQLHACQLKPSKSQRVRIRGRDCGSSNLCPLSDHAIIKVITEIVALQEIGSRKATSYNAT